MGLGILFSNDSTMEPNEICKCLFPLGLRELGNQIAIYHPHFQVLNKVGTPKAL